MVDLLPALYLSLLLLLPIEQQLLVLLFPELPLEQLRVLLLRVGGVRLRHEPLVRPTAHRRSSRADSHLDSNSPDCFHVASFYRIGRRNLYFGFDHFLSGVKLNCRAQFKLSLNS
jgi:hypothetical protein